MTAASACREIGAILLDLAAFGLERERRK